MKRAAYTDKCSVMLKISNTGWLLRPVVMVYMGIKGV